MKTDWINPRPLTNLSGLEPVRFRHGLLDAVQEMGSPPGVGFESL